MSVDFSAIIQNFLSAELGEDVRGSLVELARALQNAINSQMQNVTGDLTDADPNAAAQAKAVGDLFDISLSVRGTIPPSSEMNKTITQFLNDEKTGVWILSGNNEYEGEPAWLTQLQPAVKGGYAFSVHWGTSQLVMIVYRRQGIAITAKVDGIWMNDWVGGVDAELKREKAAADAKAVGDRFTEDEAEITLLKNRMESAESEITELDGRMSGSEENIRLLDEKIDAAEDEITELSGGFTQVPSVYGVLSNGADLDAIVSSSIPLGLTGNSIYSLPDGNTYVHGPGTPGYVLSVKNPGDAGSGMQVFFGEDGRLISRMKTAGVWTQWVNATDDINEELARNSELLTLAIKNGGTLSEGSDLNNLFSEQLPYVLNPNSIWMLEAGRAYRNAPAETGVVLTLRSGAGTTDGMQIVFGYNGAVYSRSKVAGVFSDWQGGIDKTLSVTNAAADAKTVGDRFEALDAVLFPESADLLQGTEFQYGYHNAGGVRQEDQDHLHATIGAVDFGIGLIGMQDDSVYQYRVNEYSKTGGNYRFVSQSGWMKSNEKFVLTAAAFALDVRRSDNTHITPDALSEIDTLFAFSGPTDKNLAIPNVAADAKTVGDILFGGEDHTGRTPGVNVHFAPTLADGETFDVAEMPKNSHIYMSGTRLTNVPDALQSGSVYVARLPQNAAGNVSMFFAQNLINDRVFFCDYFDNSTSAIVWREISSLVRGRNYAGAANIDELTTNGIYFIDINGAGEKTLPGFPYRVGWLLVITAPAPSYSTVEQIAVPYQTENRALIMQRSGRKNGSVYDWGAWSADEEDADAEDFIYTDFEIEEEIHWWTSSGGHYETGVISKPIPVHSGKTLYGMWFGGDPPQACGGAFLGPDRRWLAPVNFPYGGNTENANVVEYEYNHADVSPDGAALAYAKMWQVKIPEGAAYISLNLRTFATATTKSVQSLSTMPMIGATNTGNRIWRRGDPQRTAKKNKILYLIGPSTLAIDRSYRRIYTAPAYDDPTLPYPEVDTQTLPVEIIAGCQEYLIPYYDKVVSLGFDGQGYMSDGETAGVVKKIIDGEYLHAMEYPLDDADEVVIFTNGNVTGSNSAIGAADDNDLQTYCGAVNQLIDYIYEKNSGHAVRIYLVTRLIQYPDGDARAAHAKERNARFREIADLRSVALIEEEKAGINYMNYRYLSYDSNRDVYNPYGGHPNNEGNRIRGQILLNGLLNNGT